MSLQPINKSFNSNKYSSLSNKHKIVLDIKKIVSQNYDIECNVKLDFNSHNLYLNVDNSSAASDLNFKSENIISTVNYYLEDKQLPLIKHVIIKTI